MSIKFSRYSKAPDTFSDHRVRHSDSTTASVIGPSHLEHVFSVRFFKSKERNEKLAHFGQKIPCEFDAVKCSSRGRSFSNNFDPSESSKEGINERLVNTLNLKFKHVLVLSLGVELFSFGKEKATVAIDQSSKVDQVFSSKFRLIKKLTALTHKNLILGVTGIVQNNLINIHRDRLSEWTPLRRCDSRACLEISREGNNKTFRHAVVVIK